MFKYVISIVIVLVLVSTPEIYEPVISTITNPLWGVQPKPDKFLSEDFMMSREREFGYGVTNLPTAYDNFFNGILESMWEKVENDYGQGGFGSHGVDTAPLVTGDAIAPSFEPFGLDFQGYDTQGNWRDFMVFTPSKDGQEFLSSFKSKVHQFDSDTSVKPTASTKGTESKNTTEDVVTSFLDKGIFGSFGYKKDTTPKPNNTTQTELTSTTSTSNKLEVFSISHESIQKPGLSNSDIEYNKAFVLLKDTIGSGKKSSEEELLLMNSIFKSPMYAEMYAFPLGNAFGRVSPQGTVFIKDKEDEQVSNMFAETDAFYNKLIDELGYSKDQAAEIAFITFSVCELANEANIDLKTAFKISKEDYTTWWWPDDNRKVGFMNVLKDKVPAQINGKSEYSPLSLFGYIDFDSEGGQERAEILLDAYSQDPDMASNIEAAQKWGWNNYLSITTSEYSKILKYWFGDIDSVSSGGVDRTSTLKRGSKSAYIRVPFDSVSLDKDAIDKFYKYVKDGTSYSTSTNGKINNRLTLLSTLRTDIGSNAFDTFINSMRTSMKNPSFADFKTAMQTSKKNQSTNMEIILNDHVETVTDVGSPYRIEYALSYWAYKWMMEDPVDMNIQIVQYLPKDSTSYKYYITPLMCGGTKASTTTKAMYDKWMENESGLDDVYTENVFILPVTNYDYSYLEHTNGQRVKEGLPMWKTPKANEPNIFYVVKEKDNNSAFSITDYTAITSDPNFKKSLDGLPTAPTSFTKSSLYASYYTTIMAGISMDTYTREADGMITTDYSALNTYIKGLSDAKKKEQLDYGIDYDAFIGSEKPKEGK